MNASWPDFGPLWVTLRLAGVTTLLLLIAATPLAWWLAFARNRMRPFIEAVIALPLVLPPTVLGFYLLILFNPDSGLGRFWLMLTGDTLTFSFSGLVLASMIYSLPFTVQPLQAAFASMGRAPLAAAAMLHASPLDAFFTVAVPMAARGYLTAAVMTFAHTVGEFGVVLMIGGNIPGRTKVISIAIYEHVETIEYAAAHVLAGLLLVFSFAVLALVYWVNRRHAMRVA
ncbi:MAG: molybdate ABC transporter permease subunit [Gammaproteobacteria bacterium]|nr:molybdate ABC transporter permease subunit [Gammaproteobacteria bacterium]